MAGSTDWSSTATTARPEGRGGHGTGFQDRGGTIFVDIPTTRHRRTTGVGPVPRPRSEMPQLGPLEIAVVLLIALLVFGPNRLPELAKQVGGALRELKKIQQNIRADLQDMMHDESDGADPPPTLPPKADGADGAGSGDAIAALDAGSGSNGDSAAAPDAPREPAHPLPPPPESD